MDFKNKGNELFSEGKNKEAIVQYSKGIEEMLTTDSSSSPSSAEDKKLLCILYSNKAQAHLELDQFREAADSAAESLKVDPAWQKSVFRRITALFKLKAWKELCDYIENDDTIMRPDNTDSFSHDVRDFLAKMVNDAPKEEAATDTDQEGRRRAFALPTTIKKQLIARKDAADAKRKAEKEAARRNRRVTLRPDLFDCLSRIGDESRRPEVKRLSRFYPGGANWVEDPDAFLAAYADLHPEKCRKGGREIKALVQMERSGVKSQQDADRAWKVIGFVYKNELGENGEKELITKTFTLDQHRAIHKKAGYSLDLHFPANTLPKETRVVDLCFQQAYGPISQSPLGSGGDKNVLSKFRYRCDKCEAIIDMDDAPQCICGEHYCSVKCHALDFGDHRSVCRQINHSTVTDWYWDCILHGALDWPAGNLIKDYRKIWFDEKLPELLEKNPNMAMVDVLKAETEFYETTERPEAQERMEKIQEKFNNWSNEQEREGLLTCVLGEIMYQHIKYRTPLYNDSPGRLMFKILMAPVYQNIVYQQGKSVFRAIHGTVHPEKQVIDNLSNQLKASKARFEERFQSFKKTQMNEFD